MAAAKSSGEVAMHPWVGEVVMRIVRARNSNPLTVMVNVRSVGMSRHISIGADRRRLPSGPDTRGTTRRNVSMADLVTGRATSLGWLLRPLRSLRNCGNSRAQYQHNQKPQCFSHLSLHSFGCESMPSGPAPLYPLRQTGFRGF